MNGAGMTSKGDIKREERSYTGYGRVGKRSWQSDTMERKRERRSVAGVGMEGNDVI